jgi:hypothetical protein
MFFFLRPISYLVFRLIFRIFGYSLVDRQGLEGSLYTLRWAFSENHQKINIRDRYKKVVFFGCISQTVAFE